MGVVQMCRLKYFVHLALPRNVQVCQHILLSVVDFHPLFGAIYLPANVFSAIPFLVAILPIYPLLLFNSEFRMPNVC